MTTYEVIAQKELPLVRGSGSTRRFSIPVLMVSILAHLTQTTHTEDDAMELAQTVAHKITLSGAQELSPETISSLTYETLLAFDPLAGTKYGLSHGVISPQRHRN